MNPSRSIPEGVETVSAEGADLARAVATAAESIGIEPTRVEFTFDMAHFRSTTGSSVAKRTVKIIAWNTTKNTPQQKQPKKKPNSQKVFGKSISLHLSTLFTSHRARLDLNVDLWQHPALHPDTPLQYHALGIHHPAGKFAVLPV